jgi:hypothetical protein
MFVNTIGDIFVLDTDLNVFNKEGDYLYTLLNIYDRPYFIVKLGVIRKC